jgi:hypothetical protein
MGGNYGVVIFAAGRNKIHSMMNFTGNVRSAGRVERHHQAHGFSCLAKLARHLRDGATTIRVTDNKNRAEPPP